MAISVRRKHHTYVIAEAGVNHNGDIKMKVYIDIVFFTNFLFDFILLLSVNIILKRNMKIYRIILGALTGTLTLLMLFIRMNSLTLFLYKLVISIIMVLITFNYKTIKYTFKNLYFLYIVSIIMGGFLYFINNQINVKNEGLIFITSNFSLNLILGIILSSIFIYFYKDIKYILVPYNTVSGGGLLKCINISKMEVDGIKCKKKFLIGLVPSINIDGVDSIINEKIMEGL